MVDWWIVNAYCIAAKSSVSCYSTYPISISFINWFSN